MEQILEESFYSIKDDIDAAFRKYDESLIFYHLFRLNRVYWKTQARLVERGSSQLMRLQADIQRYFARCYSNMAMEDEKRSDLEAAEVKWLLCTTFEMNETYSIRYTKTILRRANFLLNRSPGEQVEWILPHEARARLQDLLHAKTVLRSVEHRSEDAELTGRWIEEMVVCIEQNGELQKGLQGNESEEATVTEVLQELEQLIGLQSVKRNIHDIYHWIQFTKMRQEQGYKAEKLSLHMIFSGHPGTGKTTVARLVARVLKALGVLSSGHLVEVSRGDLVGEYVGHTAVKTLGKLAEAKNGVLFIDEAYALTRSKGGNDFGVEAVDTIVKAMEDDRDSLVIMLAGYPAEMEEFIKSNPGLASRFKYTIDFPNYTVDEQMDILQLMLKENQYRMTDEAKEIFRRMIERSMLKNPTTHGNGRLVRNMLEDVILKKATHTFVIEGEHELDLLTADVVKAVEDSHVNGE